MFHAVLRKDTKVASDTKVACSLVGCRQLSLKKVYKGSDPSSTKCLQSNRLSNMPVTHSNIIQHKINNRLPETIFRNIFKGVKTLLYSWARSHSLSPSYAKVANARSFLALGAQVLHTCTTLRSGFVTLSYTVL